MTDEMRAGRRTFVQGAAVASAAAALVHAAAAGGHAGDRTLVVLFSLLAAAQAGWAGLALVHPTRWVAVLGGLLNGAALLAWLGSRTMGLPVIDSLREAEDVGLQDLVAASFAVVAVIGAALAVARPRWRLRLPAPISLAAVVTVMLLAVPAMAAEHVHGASGGHEHDAGTAHEGEDSAAGDHGHDGDTAAAGDTGGGHEHHEIPARLDHEPTEEQEAAARALIDDTTEAAAAYEDVDAAVRAGYESIGDGRGGFEHFIHAGYNVNPTVLDPSEPESLVYQVHADGTRELTTVMYILPPGSTMDDVPDVAGNLTVWHVHDNLCFAPGSTRLAGAVVGGRCRPGGVHRTTAPMLHVWLVPNDCGPFAGTDRAQTTGSCVDEVAR